MKKYFLLPHRFVAIGWVLLAVAIMINVLDWNGLLPNWGTCQVLTLIPDGGKFVTTNDSWSDEIAMVSAYLGLYFIAMSALREEDELTLLLRLRALMWSFTVNTVFFVALALLVYGWNAMFIFIYQGLFIFVLFILRFHWELRRMRHETQQNGEDGL